MLDIAANARAAQRGVHIPPALLTPILSAFAADHRRPAGVRHAGAVVVGAVPRWIQMSGT